MSPRVFAAGELWAVSHAPHLAWKDPSHAHCAQIVDSGRWTWRSSREEQVTDLGMLMVRGDRVPPGADGGLIALREVDGRHGSGPDAFVYTGPVKLLGPGKVMCPWSTYVKRYPDAVMRGEEYRRAERRRREECSEARRVWSGVAKALARRGVDDALVAKDPLYARLLVSDVAMLLDQLEQAERALREAGEVAA